MRVLYIAIFLAQAAFVFADQDSSWKHPEPITYESIVAWHKAGGLSGYHWPKRWEADLQQNGSTEVFLGIAGFGRGMTYALFENVNGHWKLLSDAIDGSNHLRRRQQHRSIHGVKISVSAPRGK